jgi:hypothetical protein
VTRPVEPAVTPPDSRASVGELFSEVAEDLSTLLRQEVELAKAEVRQSASRAGKGAGLLAGAGLSGHMVLLFASAPRDQRRPGCPADRGDRQADP